MPSKTPPARRCLAWIPCLLLLCGCGEGDASPEIPLLEMPAEAEYLAGLEAHREEREAGLRKPDGWFSLVGLHWLAPGENSFGSDPGNAVVFPEKAPAHLGSFHLEGEGEVLEVSVTAAPESGVALEGAELPAGEPVLLLDDTQEEGPSRLTVGSLLFYPILRGEQMGIRVKDSESEALVNFHGLDFYPPDLEWRLEGRFEAYETPKTIQVPDILGNLVDHPSHGALFFQVGGQEYQLDPISDPGEPFFLVFGDQTNGKESYGAGRFLYVDLPDIYGRVVIDFNRAYSPPCAFTPYATCPLPPKGNKLPFPIPAGEKDYGKGHP